MDAVGKSSSLRCSSRHSLTLSRTNENGMAPSGHPERLILASSWRKRRGSKPRARAVRATPRSRSRLPCQFLSCTSVAFGASRALRSAVSHPSSQAHAGARGNDPRSRRDQELACSGRRVRRQPRDDPGRGPTRTRGARMRTERKHQRNVKPASRRRPVQSSQVLARTHP
jgi:hypothetical protein